MIGLAERLLPLLSPGETKLLDTSGRQMEFM